MDSINHPVVPAPTFHPFVAIFPPMEGQPFEELVIDIKLHGLHEPIWVHKNQIVDGRNRWLACQRLGITCPMRAYGGKEADLLDFVISQNLHRRQMDASQRAMVAARIANMRQGARTDLQPSGNLQKVSRDDAAKTMQVSPESVTMANKVISKCHPEIVKAVEQGKIAVSAAAKIAEHPPEAQRQAVAKIDEGAKGAAVVRALPASSRKAKPSGPARAKPSKEQKKAWWVYASMARLQEEWWEEYYGELWDFSPSEFWPLLGSDRQEAVVKIAKMLGPWLADIIAESKAKPRPKLALAKVRVPVLEKLVREGDAGSQRLGGF
jgi:ParB-like nuclease domain